MSTLELKALPNKSLTSVAYYVIKNKCSILDVPTTTTPTHHVLNEHANSEAKNQNIWIDKN